LIYVAVQLKVRYVSRGSNPKSVLKPIGVGLVI
jgi:hypothetical protein